MERLITKDIERWYERNAGMCLLIDGARQVGKTYVIRDFLKKHGGRSVEINLHDDEAARELLSRAKSSDEIMDYLYLLYGERLVPGESIVFFDEVQEALNLVTAVKFLVEDGRFRFILSGSLLGVEMSNVKSVPVGYMEILRMYPMNFEEFLTALGRGDRGIDYLRSRFDDARPVDEAVHSRLMRDFRRYLIVGGMPAAVETYVETGNYASVADIHEFICDAYKADITKYDDGKKHMIRNVFEDIPGELNAQNKRFRYSSLGVDRMTPLVEDCFRWLIDAGVAVPVYCVDEPRVPLRAGESRSLVKLFMCDVGLLNHMYYGKTPQTDVMMDRCVNHGVVYENFVAQELLSNSVASYYFNSKKLGELDLLVQIGGEVIPIEVKSGKDYERHSALDNVTGVSNYGLRKAYVLGNGANVERKGAKTYMPVYMAMFIRPDEPDFSARDIDEGPLDVPEE